MNLIPLNDRIIVRRAPAPTKSKGGLDLPEGSVEAPAEGEVLAIPEAWSVIGVPDASVGPVKVGDFILFDKYAGVEIEVEGEKLLILRQEEVIAKVKK